MDNKNNTSQEKSFDTSQSDSVTAPANPSATHDISKTLGNYNDKSWGEKMQKGALFFTRDILVNFVANFIGSAIFAYKVDKSNFLGDGLRKLKGHAADLVKIDYTSPASIKKTEGKKELVGFLANYLTRVQLLLCGGHALVPFLKYTGDNKHRLEFSIGHKLDLLQETFGFGNEASKRSLEEYKVVAHYVAIGDNNKTNSHKIPIPELNEKTKAILEKHCVDPETLQFEEARRTWGQVAKQRLTGMAFTSAMSVGMAISSHAENKKWRFGETYEEPLGGAVGKHVLEPMFGKYFDSNYKRIKDNKTLRIVGGERGRKLNRNQLGVNMIDETIFTAGSDLGFGLGERVLFKCEEDKDKKNKKAKPTTLPLKNKELEEDKQFLTDMKIRGDDANDIAAEKEKIGHASRITPKERFATSQPTASHTLREQNRDSVSDAAPVLG